MSDPLPLVDTNIFVRHIRQDHPDHSPRASAYLGRIENGDLLAQTNELVISEAIYVLQSVYRMSRTEIATILVPIIDMPSLKIARKARLRKTLDWYVRYNVSFIDASLAVLAQEQELPAIVSFDRNYDRIPGVTRVEP